MNETILVYCLFRGNTVVIKILVMVVIDPAPQRSLTRRLIQVGHAPNVFGHVRLIQTHTAL